MSWLEPTSVVEPAVPTVGQCTIALADWYEQVTDILIRKRNINNTFTSEHMSPILIEGLTRRNQFLYIVVSIAPNQEELD